VRDPAAYIRLPGQEIHGKAQDRNADLAVVAGRRRIIEYPSDNDFNEAWRRAPVVKELQAAGCESLRAIAAGLDEYGIPAARGGKWSSTQVMRLLEAGGPFDGASGRRRMKRKRVK
jgi:Recombinase